MSTSTGSQSHSFWDGEFVRVDCVFCSATGGDDDFVVFEFDASSFTAEMGVVYEMDPVFGEVDLKFPTESLGDQGILVFESSSYPFSSTQSLNLSCGTSSGSMHGNGVPHINHGNTGVCGVFRDFGTLAGWCGSTEKRYRNNNTVGR